MRNALWLCLLVANLSGCGAFGLPEIELPTRAHASKCETDQELREVWGVWQCVQKPE